MPTIPRSRFAPTLLWAVPLALVLGALALAGDAEATHFRHGTLRWDATGVNEATFSGTQAWRLSYGSWTTPPAVGALVCDAATGGSIAGHLHFGDGAKAKACIRVTEINAEKDWFLGDIVSNDGDAIVHAYASPSPRLAFWEGYARLDQDASSHHVNNPGQSFRLETLVDMQAGMNGAPRSLLPPFVDCVVDTLCTFRLPAEDPDGDAVAFRLASESEVTWAIPQSDPPCCESFVQPGSPHAPATLAIAPASGVVSWDTTGATLSPSWPTDDTLYSFAIVLEDGATKVTVDAFLRIVPAAPSWVTPPTPCGATVPAYAGDFVSFTTSATASDPGLVVALGHGALPPGASYDVPAPAHDVTATFAWTPAPSDIGSTLLVFTATDDLGRSAPPCVVEILVENAPPVAAFSWTPTDPTDLEEVDFTDLSADVDGTVVAWSWDLGGLGTSAMQHPSFAFPDDGTYAVCLTVTDDRGAQDSACHDVVVRNAPPVAGFTWSPSEPSDMQVVAFVDASADLDGSVVSWSWDFAGLGASAEASPAFEFPDDGAYDVCLTVADDDGATDVQCHTLVVSNVPPVPAFTWPWEGQSRGTLHTASVPVQFDESSHDPDGTIVGWLWTFGDASTSTAQNPGHTYTAPGTYQVCLTVTDDDAAEGTLCKPLVVVPTLMRARAYALGVEPTSAVRLAALDTTMIISWDERAATHGPHGAATGPATVALARGVAQTTPGGAAAEEVIAEGWVKLADGTNVSFRNLRSWSSTDCDGATGNSSIGYLAVDGVPVIDQEQTPEPNTELLGGLLKLNVQAPTGYAGDGMQVSALVVRLPTTTGVTVSTSLSNVEGCDETAGAAAEKPIFGAPPGVVTADVARRAL